MQRRSWNLGGTLVLQIIIGFLFFSVVLVLVAFEYLPYSFSSTDPLAEINGLKIEHLLSSKLVEDTFFPPDHHKKAIPRPQIGIKYKTEPCKFVKPLEHAFGARGAMSAKFRFLRFSRLSAVPYLHFFSRRSLVPVKLQMWYDDHAGGIEQGHLSLGQVIFFIKFYCS
jgi:hypothetical protein